MKIQDLIPDSGGGTVEGTAARSTGARNTGGYAIGYIGATTTRAGRYRRARRGTRGGSAYYPFGWAGSCQ